MIAKVYVIAKAGETRGSRTALFSFSNNLLQVDHYYFSKSVDDFEIGHKMCLIFVWGAVHS